MRLLLTLVLATQAVAAQTEPVLYGDVFDNAGASVVHAKVTLYECGRTQPLHSEFSRLGGGFRFPLARPAKSCYTARVTAPGFKAQAISDIDQDHIYDPSRRLRITLEEDGSPPIPVEIPSQYAGPLKLLSHFEIRVKGNPMLVTVHGDGHGNLAAATWRKTPAGYEKLDDIEQSEEFIEPISYLGEQYIWLETYARHGESEFSLVKLEPDGRTRPIPINIESGVAKTLTPGEAIQATWGYFSGDRFSFKAAICNSLKYPCTYTDRTGAFEVVGPLRMVSGQLVVSGIKRKNFPHTDRH